MEFRALWLRTEAQGLNSILIENLLILVDGFRAIQRCILFEQPLQIRWLSWPGEKVRGAGRKEVPRPALCR